MAFDDIVGGKETSQYNWLGFQEYPRVLSEIISAIEIFSDMDYSTIDIDWAVKGEALLDSLDEIYNQNRYKMVMSPSPKENERRLIRSYVIDELGPKNDSVTITGIINEELNDFQEFLTLIDGVKEATEKMSGVANATRDPLFKAMNLSKTANDFVEVGIEYATETVKDYYDFIWDFDFFLFLLFFVGILIACSFGICLVMKIVLKYEVFRLFMLVGWCMMSCFSIITLLIAVLSIPSLALTMDTCKLVADFFRDENNFNNISYMVSNYTDIEISGEFMGMSHICLFGNGSLLDYFGVYSELENFDKVFDKIDNMTESIFRKIERKLIFSPAFYEANGTIEAVLNFSIPAVKTDFEDDDPTHILEEMNSWACYKDSPSGVVSKQKEFGGPDCEVTLDVIQYHSKQCNFKKYRKYSDGDGFYFNFGRKTCVGMNRMKDGAPNRYSRMQFSVCSDGIETWDTVNNAILGYYEGAYAHQKSVVEVFSPIFSDLGILHRDYNSVLQEVVDTQNEFNEIMQHLKVFEELIEGNNKTQNGSIYQVFNCTVIRPLIVDPLQSLCSQVTYSLQNFTFSITVLGILAFVANFIFFCASRTMKIVSKEEQAVVQKDDEDDSGVNASLTAPQEEEEKSGVELPSIKV